MWVRVMEMVLGAASASVRREGGAPSWCASGTVRRGAPTAHLKRFGVEVIFYIQPHQHVEKEYTISLLHRVSINTFNFEKDD